MELLKLRGMTDKKIADLNKLGIFSLEDLVRHFPNSYLDLTKQTPLKDCYHNDIVLTAAKVVGVPQVSYYGKRNKYVKFFVEQEGMLFSIVFFTPRSTTFSMTVTASPCFCRVATTSR